MSMRLGPQPAPDLNDPFAGDPDVPGEAPSASVVAPAETSTSLAPQVIERLNAVPWMAEEDAAFSIGMSILEADTLEEVFEELESRSVRQMKLVGEPLTLRSFALSPSAFASERGKCPIVAYVDAVRVDGSLIQFPIGNWGPTMQLVRAYEQGAMRAEDPGTAIKVRIIEIASKVAGRNPALRFILL